MMMSALVGVVLLYDAVAIALMQCCMLVWQGDFRVVARIQP